MITITQRPPIVVLTNNPETLPKTDAIRPKTSAATRANGNSRLFLGCLLVSGIIFGGFLLAKRKSQAGVSYHVPKTNKTVEASAPEAKKAEMVKAGSKRYLNTETWDIAWSENGLPVKVVIHRDAVQS